MKLLSYDDLKPTKGISYSRTQLWRLEKRAAFPRRVPLAGGHSGRHGWVEHEIDEWIASRIALRDKTTPQNTP
jgi:predicted DNA-binding transcriptional regulator AlpA